MYNAHIFGRKRRGDREEARLKFFNSDGKTISFGEKGLIHKVITIPHEQILTLFSVGVTLVEPTEILDYNGVPTELPMPVACDIFGFSERGPVYNYVRAADTAVMICWGTTQDWLIGRSFRQDITVEGFARLTKSLKLPGGLVRGCHSANFPLFDAGIGDLTGSIGDNALSLALSSAESIDLVGGDSSNKLILFLTYYVAKFVEMAE